MTVDREQAKRDAEHAVGYGACHILGFHVLALLAELEQAERERDALKIAEEEQFTKRGAALADAAQCRNTLAKTPALADALRLIRDGRCQCGGRFKWQGEQLRCEQCDRHESRSHARTIARGALGEWERE